MATNAYDIIVVAEDFQPTPLWQSLNNVSSNAYPYLILTDWWPLYDEDDKLSAIQKIQQQSVNYTRLSPKECISAYSVFFLSTRRNLVLVTDSPSSANGSLLAHGSYEDFAVHGNGLSWMCNATYNNRSTCRDALPNVLANVDDWRPFDLRSDKLGPRVQFCLSETVPEACSLQFSLVIILIVIICNMGKTLIMTFTTFKMIWQPLITVGDGIASFLVEPDKMTKNDCLLTANRAEDLESFSWFKFMGTSKKIRWFQSSSLRRWLVCNAL